MNKIKALLLLIFATMVCDAQEHSLQKVTLQLVWKNQFQFAGYYMAKEKGFYKDEGLDVEILEHKNGIDVVKNVLDGKSDFGIDYSSIVLQNPQKVLLLGALLQSSPHVLVSLKSSDIKRIEDFKNKKIMINSEASSAAAFIAMLRSRGVSFSQMHRIEPTYNIYDLLNKKVDLLNAYLSNEIYMLNKWGIAYNIWDPKEYGFDLYSDILFTSQKELHQHPHRVAAFKKASLQGWKYAFEHIEETVDIILNKYNTLHKSRDALIYEAKILQKLSGYGTENFFTLDVHKLQKIRDIYNVLGFISKKDNNVKLENMLYQNPLMYCLTENEKTYLRKKKVITMCTDPEWMPFESLQHGKHIGIAADYFKIFKKFIGKQTPIEVVPTKTWEESLAFARTRKCDIVSLLMQTPDRSKYLNFTKPYLKISIVMATQKNRPFTADFHTLKGKKIAIVKGYSFVWLLKKEYPELDVVEVDSMEEGLNKVAKSEVYGYVDALETIVYFMQEHHTNAFKISGSFGVAKEFRVGVRDDDSLLLGIFNKAIAHIDEEQKRNILSRWLPNMYEKSIDYGLIKKIVIFFGVILLIVGYFYQRLRKLKIKNEELSLRDPLTNLYNRRYFDYATEDIFAVFERNKEIFSILMLDIDDFKKINDTYGHKLGDKVIQSVANVLQEHSRKSDIVSRYGGEEFIVLLQNTKSKHAIVHAEQIRKKIEKLQIDNVYVTVSMGVSEVTKSDFNIEDVLKRADDALYMAKAKGKNTVVIVDE